MARLLRDLDYLRLIQSDNLAQVIESNQQTKLDVEQAAQAEMISYLSQRYIVNEIFTNTTVFDVNAVYLSKNLVEYTETAFSISSSYTSGVSRVVYQGNIYVANIDVTPSVWDASKWDLLCADKTLFYLSLPQPEFDYYTTYQVGDIVWYANKTYTCAIASQGVFPSSSTAFWGTGVDYSVTGQKPSGGNVNWTQGDNRNQQIVLFLLDITLYHLHSRINPRNIPDLRKERYNGNDPMDRGGAIGWLKSVAHGNVNADLPVIAPTQGLSMRYGNAGTNTEPSKNMMW
jgi:hypothetical protein